MQNLIHRYGGRLDLILILGIVVCGILALCHVWSYSQDDMGFFILIFAAQSVMVSKIITSNGQLRKEKLELQEENQVIYDETAKLAMDLVEILNPIVFEIGQCSMKLYDWETENAIG